MSASSPSSPAIIVYIAGNCVSPVLSANISSTNGFSADTFAVTFAIGSERSNNLTFWSSLDGAYVEILSANKSTYLITGMIDKVTIDILRQTVRIHGRDLSSLLIDSSPQQDFVNQTPAEIVTSIANRHGLNASVTAIGSISGRYYGSNYTRLSLSKFTKMRSDWDIVVQLAREVRCDTYVFDRYLYFVEPSISNSITTYIRPDMLSALRIERTLWIPKSPTVQICSWNSQDRVLYSQDQSAFGKDPQYVFSGTNMTAEQLSQEAARYTSEIVRLRESLFIEMPWDESVSTRNAVFLCGTNSAIDGIYRVDDLERRFSSSTGSKQQMLLSKLDTWPF